MALQDACERLQYHARATAGVQVAPDNVDLSAGNSDVYSLSFARTGTFDTEAAAQSRDIHNLVTQIIVKGSEVLAIEQRAEGILETFVNKLRNDLTLNGTVTTIVGPITYQIVRAVEQDKTTLTMEIITQVKIRGSF
jgi:hypothetical protein